MDMKYAIILADGAADEPIPELGGRTPLQVANTPFLDALVEQGRIGTVRTVPEGLPPGSDVATMSLLGYDPVEHYSGRAPIEAVARNVPLAPEDIVFRCNLVTVTDGVMVDSSAGHISTAEADQIIQALNEEFRGTDAKFYTGVSYRHMLVTRDPEAMEVSCMPPYDIPGEAVAEYLPKGSGARKYRALMERGSRIAAAHEVNQVRRDLGELPATAIWLWGQGRVPILRRFRQRFGVRGAVIAAVDLIRGLGKLLGWPVIDVPGATGYIDTDYAAKGRAAVQALDDYDLVMVHIEAPDEAGHLGDAAAKIEAIEKIDELVVGPVLEKLRRFESWRILVAPDHPTPVAKRTHTSDPVPFCLAGSGVPQGVATGGFSESVGAQSDLYIEKGYELMEYFLRR